MANRPTKFKSDGKVKRFAEGGFSPEQEKWLGGADRTDPYILARMRRAVPDKAPVRDANPGKTPAQLRMEGNSEEAVNNSEESQAIANEARGDTMLKAMRDEAPVPRPRLNVGTTSKPSASSAAAPASQRKMTAAESMAELNRATGAKPMDMNSDRGPNAVTGNDFTRNVSNTMGALTPIGGGLGKIGVELAMGRKGAEAATKGAQVAEKGREAVTNPMAWAGGPKSMETIQKVENATSKAAAKAAKAKERTSGQIPDYVTNGGAVGYKKGGKVDKNLKNYPSASAAVKAAQKRGDKAITVKFAKGGSVSSASRRGDGIAIRGKTKGTMVMCSGGMYKSKK